MEEARIIDSNDKYKLYRISSKNVYELPKKGKNIETNQNSLEDGYFMVRMEKL